MKPILNHCISLTSNSLKAYRLVLVLMLMLSSVTIASPAFADQASEEATAEGITCIDDESDIWCFGEDSVKDSEPPSSDVPIDQFHFAGDVGGEDPVFADPPIIQSIGGEDPVFADPTINPSISLLSGSQEIMQGESFTLLIDDLDMEACIQLPDGIAFDGENSFYDFDALSWQSIYFEEQAQIVHIVPNMGLSTYEVKLIADSLGEYRIILLEESSKIPLCEQFYFSVVAAVVDEELGSSIVPLADLTFTFIAWQAGDDPVNPSSYSLVFSLQELDYGEPLVDPGTPASPSADLVFVGWYASGDTEPFEIDSFLYYSMTLYARYDYDWTGVHQAADLSELKQLLNNAPADTPVTIELTADITYTSPVDLITIAAGKVIRLTSADDPDSPFAIDASSLTHVIQVDTGAYLTLEDITIKGGDFQYLSSNQGGSGVNVNGTLIINSGTVITENYSTGYEHNGGGVGVAENGTVVMNDGEIVDNHAYNGGGVCTLYDSSQFIMNGGEITNNTAEYYGGGIHQQSGTVYINGGTISSNESEQWGGGLSCYRRADYLFITGGTFMYNHSAVGGGIYIEDFYPDHIGSLTIRNITLFSNRAGLGGGGIDCEAYLEIYDAYFYYNEAGSSGGGLFTGPGLHMERCEFYGNTAGFDGGGLSFWAPEDEPSVWEQNRIIDSQFISNRVTYLFPEYDPPLPSRNGGGAIFLWDFFPKLTHELFYFDNVVFSGNSSTVLLDWTLSDEMQAMHDSHINDTDITYPFLQSYNNADIYYRPNVARIEYIKNYGEDQRVYYGPMTSGQDFPTLYTQDDIDKFRWDGGEDLPLLYWSLTPDGSSGRYVPPEKFPVFPDMWHPEIIRLYAIYGYETFNITYNLNASDAVNAPGNPTSYTPGVDDFPITINIPTRTGYRFERWYGYYVGSSTTINARNLEIPDTATGDLLLYAEWNSLRFDIDYELNGGINAPGNPQQYTIEDLPVEIASPTKPGFGFLGWTVDYQNDDILDINDPVLDYLIPEGTLSHLKLTAVWLDLQGVDPITGLAKTASVDSYHPGDDVDYTISFQLPDNLSTYAGLRIRDAYPSNALELNDYTFTVDNEPLSIPILRELGYNCVDYRLSTADLTGLEGKQLTLSLSFTVRLGSFGTITNYANVYITPTVGEEFMAASESVSITELPYTLSYNGNGSTSGSVPVDPQSPYFYGSEATVLGPGNLARIGYTYLGWSLNQQASYPEYQAGDEITVDSDVTLYAVWKADIKDFAKSALLDAYMPGQTVRYEISFVLPDDTSQYGWLMIVDTFPDDILEYVDNSAALTIGGQPALISETNLNPPTVSFVIDRDQLVDSGGKQVSLTMAFLVSAAAEDTIINDADVFIVPLNGPLPDEPDESDDTTVDRVDRFLLTVINGSGSGRYEAGTSVNVVADPAPAGYVFDRWISDSGDALDDPTAESFVFIMPDHDVTLRATYVAEQVPELPVGPGGTKPSKPTVTPNTGDPVGLAGSVLSPVLLAAGCVAIIERLTHRRRKRIESS